MRTVAVIQSRCGSSRLPGKALMTIGGRQMVAHVIERALAIPGLDDVILATSTADRDDAIAAIAVQQGIQFWRGSEADVLGRFTQAAQFARADVVLRITGDCPLLCPDVAQQVLDVYRAGPPSGYAWNDTAVSGWPDGLDVEVFSMALLTTAEAQTRRDARSRDREHVTIAVRRLASVVAVAPSPVRLAHLKLSVDTQIDYDRVVRVAAHVDGDLSWRGLLSACIAAGVVTPSQV